MYVDSAESEFLERVTLLRWRDASKRTNKAAARLIVGGFAAPAIIRNGSLRGKTVILRKFKMKILQRHTLFALF
jgi:hypothetical protein